MNNLRFLLILPKKIIINRSSSQIVILHHSRLLESVYFHPCSNGVGLLGALHFQKTFLMRTVRCFYIFLGWQPLLPILLQCSHYLSISSLAQTILQYYCLVLTVVTSLLGLFRPIYNLTVTTIL